MKQSLQLRLGQHITMTPQLQQAIRLLQLSSLELKMEIQKALESNMMLEEVDEYNNTDNDEPNNGNDNNHDEKITVDNNNEVTTEASPDTDDISFEYNNNNEEIPQDLAVDSSWEDIYDTSYSVAPSNDDEMSARDLAIQNNTAEKTLQDHLLQQLNLITLSKKDELIARAIIDTLNEDGYLETAVEEIAEILNKDRDDDLIEVQEVKTVLRRIQNFDPVGIGARDLSECLLLQLNELDDDIPWVKEGRVLVSKYIHLLSGRDFTQLSRKMKLNREQLQQVMAVIQKLNPRPGGQVVEHIPNYVVPDVFVKKVKEVWKVELNPDTLPKLRVNSHYASLISYTKKETDVSSLKTHLQEARWFIKSLKSRHETLLKVAGCIVRRQSAFLDYGEEAMKPMVLHDIAQELEMHESTISRVTTQKYIHTPRGIFELKYFFSSHVSTDNGGEFSSTAIRALIKKLIAAENVAKPLSDSKIAGLLSERGIKVARRTVAKYREAMVIPPSNERKRLA